MHTFTPAMIIQWRQLSTTMELTFFNLIASNYGQNVQQFYNDNIKYRFFVWQL